VGDFGRFLGHDPTLADLDDDIVTGWQKHLKGSKLSRFTVNERVGRVIRLWTFLAKRRLVERFPSIKRLRCPEIVPAAFTAEQLKALFDSAEEEGGRIAGVRASHGWQALLAFIWSTGERKGATLALRWDWIDRKAMLIVIPAQYRKGRQKAGVYHLWPEVAELIDRIALPKRELVFPWDRNAGMYWKDWNRLLVRAGLPADGKHKTKALRVSHASWLKALGGDPTAALMHGDSATTIKHYLDPRLLAKNERVLFVPWQSTDAKQSAADGAEVIALNESPKHARKLPKAKALSR
jgi:integrase